ncbi:hypothetical protein GCM10027580_06440 [Corynebacterium faecale]
MLCDAVCIVLGQHPQVLQYQRIKILHIDIAGKIRLVEAGVDAFFAEPGTLWVQSIALLLTAGARPVGVPTRRSSGTATTTTVVPVITLLITAFAAAATLLAAAICATFFTTIRAVTTPTIITIAPPLTPTGIVTVTIPVATTATIAGFR